MKAFAGGSLRSRSALPALRKKRYCLKRSAPQGPKGPVLKARKGRSSRPAVGGRLYNHACCAALFFAGLGPS
ncbi:MAG TPA: hypothetical protein VLS90_02980, partial [Thermodesulfobacteriota bacterium]|nr:hypothetical protein [Thermodesulfobacteriota bacterium]